MVCFLWSSGKTGYHCLAAQYLRSHSQSSYGINVIWQFFFFVLQYFWGSFCSSISLPSDTYLSSVRETSAQTWYHTNQFEEITIPFPTHLPSSLACLQGAQYTKQTVFTVSHRSSWAGSPLSYPLEISCTLLLPIHLTEKNWYNLKQK